MPFTLPPLAALRSFEAAARLGSFRKAAEELNLTPSAVSHAIDALESWMGLPLFDRHGRSIRLNAAGEDFLPYVAQGLSLIAVGARRVSPHLGTRCVTLSTTPSVASHWLVPRLPRFQAAHPDIELCLDTSKRLVLFPLDRVDLAIRMLQAPTPDTEATLLFRESLVPLASPQVRKTLLDDEGAIRWQDTVLLHVYSGQHDWGTWMKQAGVEIKPRGHLYFDAAGLAWEAAALGAGIVLGRLPLCQRELDAGRLVTLGGEPVPSGLGYWLALPVGTEPRRDVLQVRRWLLREARAGTAADEFDSSE